MRATLTLFALVSTLGASRVSLARTSSAHPPQTSSHAAAQPHETEPDVELAPPRAIATLQGPNPSYVGQMVRVEVELLRDDRETDKPAPFFPEIRVRDAIAILSEHAPPPESRTIEEVTFLVQKRVYLVFPQTPGDLTVPVIAVSLPGTGGRPLRVLTKPLKIHADVPRGAGSRSPLVAGSVELRRSIDGPLDQLRVGDAFTVTLKLTATDTDPVLLPALSLPEIPGLSRYEGEPSSRARADRGSYQAERTESVTYVATDFGFYKLPRTSLFWLDPSTGNYAEAAVPELAFRARVNPSLGTGCLGGGRAMARVSGLAGATGLLVLLVLTSIRRFRARQRRLAVVQRSQGERAAFAELRVQAESGRDGPTLSALYRWLRFVVPGVPTLRAWLPGDAPDSLHNPIMSLEQRVTTGRGPGQATEIVSPLTRYRRRQRTEDPAVHRLPDLNSREPR